MEKKQTHLELEATIAELGRTKGDAQISHHEEFKKLEEELRSVNEIKEILQAESIYGKRIKIAQAECLDWKKELRTYVTSF